MSSIRITKLMWATVLAASAMLWSFAASASALHAFCFSPTPTCSDNGTVTPTTDSSPNFGFWYSSGPATGDYLIDILVPNSYALPSAYTVSYTDGVSGSVTSSEIGSGWTSGKLDTYLGFSAQPNNPIGAWLPTSLGSAPGATGYYVFQADLGTQTLPGAAGTGLDLNAGSLLAGTVVVGFLGIPSTCKSGPCTDWVATANSGALYEGKVPEPGTLALFAAGLLGCALFLRRRARHN